MMTYYPRHVIEGCPLYQHYKGSLYRFLMTANLSEDRDTAVVVYWSVDKMVTWVRPLVSKPGVDAWNDDVVWPDGVTRPRFIPVVAPVEE